MTIKLGASIALLLLFLGGSGYFVWAGRPVLQMERVEEDTASDSLKAIPPSVADSASSTRASTSSSVSIPAPNPAPKPIKKPIVKTEKTYTLATVQAHATREDCWAVISGHVYNLTSWVSRHPGGENPIVRLCGTDGTLAFSRKHGGALSPAKALILLKIGALAL